MKLNNTTRNKFIVSTVWTNAKEIKLQKQLEYKKKWK